MKRKDSSYSYAIDLIIFKGVVRSMTYRKMKNSKYLSVIDETNNKWSHLTNDRELR